MNVDLRRFDFPLHLQTQRLQWRLDAAMSELARVQSEGARRRDAARACAQALAAALVQASPAAAGRIDPASVRHALAFVAVLQARDHAARDAVAQNEREASGVREQLADVQRQMEAIAALRVEALDEHRREVERRQGAELDQDWITRRHARMSRTQDRDVVAESTGSALEQGSLT